MRRVTAGRETRGRSRSGSRSIRGRRARRSRAGSARRFPVPRVAGGAGPPATVGGDDPADRPRGGVGAVGAGDRPVVTGP